MDLCVALIASRRNVPTDHVRRRFSRIPSRGIAVDLLNSRSPQVHMGDQPTASAFAGNSVNGVSNIMTGIEAFARAPPVNSHTGTSVNAALGSNTNGSPFHNPLPGAGNAPELVASTFGASFAAAGFANMNSLNGINSTPFSNDSFPSQPLPLGLDSLMPEIKSSEDASSQGQSVEPLRTLNFPNPLPMGASSFNSETPIVPTRAVQGQSFDVSHLSAEFHSFNPISTSSAEPSGAPPLLPNPSESHYSNFDQVTPPNFNSHGFHSGRDIHSRNLRSLLSGYSSLHSNPSGTPRLSGALRSFFDHAEPVEYVINRHQRGCFCSSVSKK